MNNSPLQTPVLKGYSVILRPIKQTDLEQLRTWRNLPEINQRMLSQEPISAEQQMTWFNNISSDQSQQHFVIEYKNRSIGAANIKSKEKAQPVSTARAIVPGLYLGEEKYRNNIVAFAPTLLLNDYCFNILACPKLHAIVKADNYNALNYNKKLGYKVVSIGDFVELELCAEDFRINTKIIKGMLSRPSNEKGKNE